MEKQEFRKKILDEMRGLNMNLGDCIIELKNLGRGLVDIKDLIDEK